MVDPAREDERDEAAVLMHVIESHPMTLSHSDLIRELSASDAFGDRDRIERAIRELVKGGLLFRCGGTVLPTRSALYFAELEAV